MPAFPANTAKPPRYAGVRLIFDDGSTCGGVWTGREWWCDGQRVQPKAWEHFPLNDPGARLNDDSQEPSLLRKGRNGSGGS